MSYLFAAVAAASLGWAEPNRSSPTAEEVQAEQREFAKWAAAAAAGYDIRRRDAARTPLVLRRGPVLKWSNPERGRIYGHVFLWTDEGRPAAIASMYKWFHPFTHSSHEFESLALGGLTAEREGRSAWDTTQPGVKLRSLTDAPAPADAAAERLRQARALARRFRAEETNREGERFPLRLLTQPIYRYESVKTQILDGALFAFVQATDPEMLLLVETRLDEAGNPSWQYGLARLNSIAMRAFYDDAEVWTASELPWAVVRDRSQPYFTVQFR